MANSCETCKHYEVEAYNEPCVSCRFRDYDVPTKWENPFKQKTNADCIRSMSDEELVEFLGQYKFFDICKEGCNACTYNGDCDKRLLEWLKQPVEG